MKSILVTYPGFQSLPKGIKRMLVESENLFFEEATMPPRRSEGKPGAVSGRNLARARFSRPALQVLPPGWEN